MSPVSIDPDKVLVADAAYDFPLADLPKGTAAVLRYVGPPDGTPHIVSVGQVEAIRRAGMVWAPIWTPAARVLSHQLGLQAGNGMVAALKAYPLLGPEPVFLDVEKHVYDADPAGCRAAVAAWQSVMHLAGWSQAYAYLPSEANSQWVADWVDVAPHHFAPGVIGVQYQGAVHGDEYDLSVFARTVFQPLIDAQKGSPLSLTTSDKQWMVDQLALVQHNLGAKLSAYQWDNDKAHAEPAANVHLAAKLDQLLALVQAGHSGTVDTAALAKALSAALGPSLADDLARELSRRLAS